MVQKCRPESSRPVIWILWKQSLEIFLPSHVSLPGFHNTNLRPSGELFLPLNTKHFSCPYKMTMRMFRFPTKTREPVCERPEFPERGGNSWREWESATGSTRSRRCARVAESVRIWVCKLSCLWGFSFASASGLPIQTENPWSSLLNCSTIITLFVMRSSVTFVTHNKRPIKLCGQVNTLHECVC